MTLDRTRPFSTVYGIAEHAFSQDGKLFDREGNELGAKPTKAAKAAKEADAPAAADDQVSTQLEG